jgi:hypothetical protein
MKYKVHKYCNETLKTYLPKIPTNRIGSKNDARGLSHCSTVFLLHFNSYMMTRGAAVCNTGVADPLIRK